MKASSSRRGQARSDAILDAALELVREVGYSRVTTDAIAARASASKMTLYRKWPTKAALIADALRRQSEGPRPDAADTGSLRSDLVATLDGILESLRGDQRPSLLDLAEPMRADPELRDLIRQQLDDRSTADGTAIATRAAGRGDKVDPSRGPAAVSLSVAYLFTFMLLHGGPPSPAERATFVDTVLLPMLR